MHTLSPSIDRIGAALKALRQSHAGKPAEHETALGKASLDTVIAQLAAEGVSREDLKPLSDLIAYLERLNVPQGSTAGERRKNIPPSDAFLARVAAVIDLLIKSGSDEEEAAQLIMRRLMAAGVPPPRQGGDARGWKRLLEWKDDLAKGLASDEAMQEYRRFTQELDTIPAQERLSRVLADRLWDRRKKVR
jgi:hypothetical protein